MAKLTMVFGLLLVAISAGFWIAMGRTEMAALHPGGVGVLLLLCGVLANTENARRRMLWMHLAVTFGLIGFLITGIGVLRHVVGGHPSPGGQAGFDERVVVALVCLVFVALCVRSFITARRERLASA